MRDAAVMGRRLEKALAAGNTTMHGLHARLRDEGIRGSGYASVRSYVTGKVRPGLEFIRASANALGVREEWLEHGKGEMHAAAEGARSVKELLLLEQYHQLSPPGVERLPRKLPSLVRNNLLGLLLEVADIGSEEIEGSEAKPVGVTIAELFLAPFGTEGVVELDTLSDEELLTFSHAYIAMIRPLVMRPGRPR